MERKKVLFAVNLFLLAFLGIFGLFLQAKEEQKIMSVEVKTENELDRMKEILSFMRNMNCPMTAIMGFIIYPNPLIQKN